MTTRRLIASLTVSSAAPTLAATVAVRSFPLEAQGTGASHRVRRRADSDCQRRRSPAARLILGVSTQGNRAAGPGRGGMTL